MSAGAGYSVAPRYLVALIDVASTAIASWSRWAWTSTVVTPGIVRLRADKRHIAIAFRRYRHQVPTNGDPRGD
jgi:hypothetical protein